MAQQQKGSITKLLMSIETTWNTVVAAASRKVAVLPFISESFGAGRPQNISNVIRARRDGNSQPYLGFRDVKGSIQLPLDFINAGRIFKMLLGAPVTTPTYTGADVKTGSPTCTVGVAGAYTLSAAQPVMLAGDIFVLTLAGVVSTAWITTYTNTTTGVIKNERAGGTAIPAGAYTVSAIIRNKYLAATVDPTITIVNGVGTVTVAPNTAATVNDRIIYTNTAGVFTAAYIASIVSTTVFNLTDAAGFPLPASRNVSAQVIDGIFLPGTLFSHYYAASQTAGLPSYTFEKQFNDLSPNKSIRYTGCKAGQVGINIGGDQELVLSVDFVGADTDEPLKVDALDSYRYATTPVVTGTGNGTIGVPVITVNNSVENWVLTCTVPASNAGTFSVVGSVSGRIADATVAVAYATGGLSFTIADGSTDFISGDTITFSVGSYVKAEFTPGFEQFDALISEGGSQSDGDPIQSANVTIGNNLDESGYTINGQGVRTQLPEGIMGCSYQVHALLTNASLIEKASGDTESSLAVTFTNASGATLTVSSARVKYSQADPQISGPQGVVFDLAAMAYNNIEDTLPSVVVTLVNSLPGYE